MVPIGSGSGNGSRPHRLSRAQSPAPTSRLKPGPGPPARRRMFRQPGTGSQRYSSSDIGTTARTRSSPLSNSGPAIRRTSRSHARSNCSSKGMSWGGVVMSPDVATAGPAVHPIYRGGPAGRAPAGPYAANQLDMSLTIDPGVLRDNLIRVRDNNGAVPLMVTENGASYVDTVAPDTNPPSRAACAGRPT